MSFDFSDTTTPDDLTPLERIDSHTSNTGGFPESTVLIIATGLHPKASLVKFVA